MSENSILYDVIAGSYDGYIYGMSALIEKKNEFQSTASDSYNATIVQQFIERAHSSHIKVLSSSWPHLATAGVDDVIKLYNLETLREVGSLHQHMSKVQHMEFLPSSHLLTLSEDGELIVWSVRGWRPIRTLSLGEKGKAFTYFAVHPSEKLLFALNPNESTISLCDLRTARCAYSMKLSERPVAIECSPGGDLYALVHSRTLSVYTMDSTEAVCSLQLRESSEINCVLFLRNDLLVIGGEIGFIKIVTLDTVKRALMSERECEAHENRVKSLKGNMPFLFSCSTDGVVKVWYLCCAEASDLKIELIGDFELKTRLTSLTVSCISGASAGGREEKQLIRYEHKFQKMVKLFREKRRKSKFRSRSRCQRFLLSSRLRRNHYRLLRRIKVQNF